MNILNEVIIITEKYIPDFERKSRLDRAIEYLALLKNIEQEQRYSLDHTVYLLSNSAQMENELKLYEINVNLMEFARLTQFSDYDKMQEIFALLPKIKEELYKYIALLKKDKINVEDITTPNYKNYFSPNINSLERILVEVIFEQYNKNPSLYYSKSDVPLHRKKTVLERDHYTCQYCGNKFDEKDLQVDHIYPHCLGGSNHENNLMTLCSEHNRQKLDSLNFFKREERITKMKENIYEFIRETQIIGDFGSWLKKMSDARVRRAWIKKKKEEIKEK